MSPISADTISVMRRISQNGSPLRSWSAAITHAAKPITEATDRSISPATITNVMATTTMIFSIDSSNRLTKLLTLRYPSDWAMLKTTEANRTAPSSAFHDRCRSQSRMRRHLTGALGSVPPLAGDTAC